MVRPSFERLAADLAVAARERDLLQEEQAGLRRPLVAFTAVERNIATDFLWGNAS